MLNTAPPLYQRQYMRIEGELIQEFCTDKGWQTYFDFNLTKAKPVHLQFAVTSQPQEPQIALQMYGLQPHAGHIDHWLRYILLQQSYKFGGWMRRGLIFTHVPLFMW
eukprot:TRINITY_DN67240_c13_g4_i1.p1 TRINITY_DN67240_c13_g4~~TRINITY_DN67240_c13_g4_i1.p1  ORF type:complete len:107 (+),score=8.85 TRINITY_DN67240_c13_g4_i1:195-515(+)